MRSAGLFVVLVSGLLLASSPTQGHADDKKRDAELKWAKHTANEFLEVLLATGAKGELSTSPVALVSPELWATEKQFKAGSGLAKIAWQYRGAKFRITAAEMAPSGCEVSFHGELTPLSEKEYEERMKENSDEQAGAETLTLTQLFLLDELGPRQDKPADFTLRMARKSKSGRWTVQLMRVKTKARK